jgi:hypothetical protein
MNLLVDQLRTNNVVLLRSHPGSGKTTLAEELRKYCDDRHLRFLYTKLTGATQLTYEHFFMDYTLHYFNTLSEDTTPPLVYSAEETFLVIDEAQEWYGREDAFWKALGSIVGRRQRKLRVLILATYRFPFANHSSPRLNLPEVGRFYDFLQMEEDDVGQLHVKLAMHLGSTNVNAGTRTPLPLLSDDVIHSLFELTSGHPFITAYILTSLLKDQNHTNPLRLLTATSVIDDVKSLRPFGWLHLWPVGLPEVSDIKRIVRATKVDVLEFDVESLCPAQTWDSFLNRDTRHQVPTIHQSILTMVYELEKPGLWMCLDPLVAQTRFRFTSRLAYDIFYRKAFSGNMLLQDSEESLETFVIHCLESVKPDPKNFHIELLRDKDFHMGASAILSPASHMIHSQFAIGRKKLDFKIDGNGLNWGVELSTASTAGEAYVREHCLRFASGGSYHPAGLTNWRNVHFIQSPTHSTLKNLLPLLLEYPRLRIVVPTPDVKGFTYYKAVGKQVFLSNHEYKNM